MAQTFNIQLVSSEAPLCPQGVIGRNFTNSEAAAAAAASTIGAEHSDSDRAEAAAAKYASNTQKRMRRNLRTTRRGRVETYPTPLRQTRTRPLTGCKHIHNANCVPTHESVHQRFLFFPCSTGPCTFTGSCAIAPKKGFLICVAVGLLLPRPSSPPTCPHMWM